MSDGIYEIIGKNDVFIVWIYGVRLEIPAYAGMTVEVRNTCTFDRIKITDLPVIASDSVAIQHDSNKNYKVILATTNKTKLKN